MGRIKRLEIDDKIIEELKKIIKEDNRYRVRKRANAIVYKSQGYSVKEISRVLDIRVDTVYKWIRRYEMEGVESVYDKKGRGRKAIIDDKDFVKIKALVINSPSIPVANAKVREELNIFVCDSTLKNYVKKNLN